MLQKWRHWAEYLGTRCVDEAPSLAALGAPRESPLPCTLCSPAALRLGSQARLSVVASALTAGARPPPRAPGSSLGEALHRGKDSAHTAAHARDMRSGPEAREGQGEEARSEQSRRGGWPVEAPLAGELERKAGLEGAGRSERAGRQERPFRRCTDTV